MRRALAAAACAALLWPAVPSYAATGPALSLDAAADRHAISPDVYGMNFADPALAAELGLTINRWGGNSTSRYNWTNNTTNLASDWYFENYVRPAGDTLDAFVAASLDAGANPVVTVPMSGWVAKTSPANHPWYCSFSVAKYGAQTGHDEWDPDCGNGIRASTGQPIAGNDPSETSVAAGPAFVKSMVAHLAATHGDAAHGGVRTYMLDNEPSLWDDVHRDVHPAAPTYDELGGKSVATATAVKAADPGARTAGPSEWGWCAYFFSPADSGGCGDGPDRQAHGGQEYSAWYLARMKAASDAAGKRLLDYFDQHYYPQTPGVSLGTAGDASTQAARLRSTRSLWDPAYRDESWIGDPGQVGADPIRLIPWLREQVAAHYPGTRTMLSEYNWGGLESLNGALAQADVLGIFGRERLDAALLWDPPATTQPGAYAFRMYRNYDGNGGRFGDTGVRATSDDQGQLAVYGAQRTPDGAVTAMVVNKTGGDLTSTLALSGARYGSAAAVYRYSAASLGAIQHLADVAVTGGAVTATYPANSITLLVLPTVPTVLTSAVSPVTVTYGAAVTATGRLTSGGVALGGRTVTLQARRKGSTTWTNAGTATSASDGRLARSYAPPWTAALRWSYAGDATHGVAVSPAVAVTVGAKVRTTLSPTSMPLGSTATISGSVSPAHPSTSYALQRWVTGYGWKSVGTYPLTASSTYRRTSKPSARGTYKYRVLWLGDTDHAAAAGPTVTLAVT